MTHTRCLLVPLVGVLLALAVPPVAHAHEGHTSWGPWRFEWEVRDGAGISIRYVYYNNQLVFWKASLPVIRVKYDRRCGPFADRIMWDNLVKISNCGDSKVCQQAFTVGGQQWLELGVYARIGSYHLYQSWYFSYDGYIDARMWSKGLQCEVDHDHHPYWRLDFDLNGASSDQVFVYDNNRPNEGWGPGLHKYPTELNDVKSPATSRIWFVRDNPTGYGAWVYPGPDGVVDGFSTKDAAPRLYHGSEDEPWPFGAWGHLGYNDGEDVAEEDIILWYVAHMHHAASGGGSQWHWAGPLFRLYPWPPLGIAGYDLLSTSDRALAFDYNHDGNQDLFLYRPGTGAAWVARSNGDGTFTGVYTVGDNGPATPNGIAGYDLLSTSDRALAFDYNHDGNQDLFLYRPGRGAAWVARSNGDGTFTGVYTVGDNGPATPNGIAGYDLLSTSDQVLAFDYNHDGNQDLFLYRPGEGAARVAKIN